MDELRAYVDELFRHQRLTIATKDLKEEILSNMLAKRNDLMEQGMSENEATKEAKASLVSVDGLVEGNQLTDVDRYHAECLQAVLLGCVIFWIFSLPLLFTRYALYSYFGLFATIVAGVFYLTRKKEASAVAFLSVSARLKRKKIVWTVWVLFFLVYVGTMAALTFGSNLWFGRPLHITGPYQMANIAARFYIPLLTIAIPITFSSFTRILYKHEKGPENEEKE